MGTLEDIKTIHNMLSSEDDNINKLGVSLLFKLDINKFCDIILIFWSIHKSKIISYMSEEHKKLIRKQLTICIPNQFYESLPVYLGRDNKITLTQASALLNKITYIIKTPLNNDLVLDFIHSLLRGNFTLTLFGQTRKYDVLLSKS